MPSPLNTYLVPMHPVQTYEMWPDKDFWVMRAKDSNDKMSRTPIFLEVSVLHAMNAYVAIVDQSLSSLDTIFFCLFHLNAHLLQIKDLSWLQTMRYIVHRFVTLNRATIC